MIIEKNKVTITITTTPAMATVLWFLVGKPASKFTLMKTELRYKELINLPGNKEIYHIIGKV